MWEIAQPGSGATFRELIGDWPAIGAQLRITQELRYGNPQRKRELGGAIRRPSALDLATSDTNYSIMRSTRESIVKTMHRAVSRDLILKILCLLMICILTGEFVVTTNAGLRGIGKYCGVVVFDRWDTCFLLSGPYITYIAESTKDELRPYKGKAMQVDASKVFQHQNPGDALIEKYKIVGSAPDTGRWGKLDGLELVADSDFGPKGTPTFVIEIRNTGSSPVSIDSSEIGPTLIGSVQKSPFTVSDGASTAVITRATLVTSSSWQSTIDGVTYSASFWIDPVSHPPQRFQLEPGQSRKTRVTFEVSPGQYQFLFGYGGGVHEEKSLASNAISFDVTDSGIATLAE
jgi:hypothetical protein